MNETLDPRPSRDEDSGRKAWCDPVLVEYDVEAVTAGAIGAGPDLAFFS